MVKEKYLYAESEGTAYRLQDRSSHIGQGKGWWAQGKFFPPIGDREGRWVHVCFPISNLSKHEILYDTLEDLMADHVELFL